MLQIGSYVKIINTSYTGIIKRIIKNKDQYMVEVNQKHMILYEKDLIPIPIPVPTHPPQHVKLHFQMVKEPLPSEIMLRHQTVDEALMNLDIFISHAIANRMKKIKIIHGRHGGILRNAVHDYLKSCPYIKEFHLGNYFEGSIGVTIAILK